MSFIKHLRNILKTVPLIFAMVGISLASFAEGSAALTKGDLAKIGFDQKIGGAVSLDLPFRDESGRAEPLRNYIHGKPAIIVLGYYRCPMLCTLMLNGLISTLQDLKPSVGEKFSVLFISIEIGRAHV